MKSFNQELQEHLQGIYTDVQQIGQGGMSSVYSGVELLTGKKVAIKVLLERYSYDQEYIQRFERETRISSALVHPNIVKIYDIYSKNRLHYFTMEFVEGESLKYWIRQRSFSPKETIQLLLPMLNGLDYAHKQGVIHRDIKPDNILVSFKNSSIEVVKLMDFGIARQVDDSTITQIGMVVGSAHYMAPEQVKGIRELTPACDLYAVGIIAFELLTQELPFSGTDMQSIMYKHVKENPPHPIERNASIPTELSKCIVKLLEKKPEQRYQSAAELHNVLSQMADSLDQKNSGSEISSSNTMPTIQEPKKADSLPVIIETDIEQNDISPSSNDDQLELPFVIEEVEEEVEVEEEAVEPKVVEFSRTNNPEIGDHLGQTTIALQKRSPQLTHLVAIAVILVVFCIVLAVLIFIPGLVCNQNDLSALHIKSQHIKKDTTITSSTQPIKILMSPKFLKFSASDLNVAHLNEDTILKIVYNIGKLNAYIKKENSNSLFLSMSDTIDKSPIELAFIPDGYAFKPDYEKWKENYSQIKTLVCLGENVNVRKGPGLEYNPIGRLSRGDIVRILQLSENIDSSLCLYGDDYNPDPHCSEGKETATFDYWIQVHWRYSNSLGKKGWVFGSLFLPVRFQ